MANEDMLAGGGGGGEDGGTVALVMTEKMIVEVARWGEE